MGTDEEVFNRIFSHSSFAQLRLVFEAYKNLTGKTIEQALQSEMDGSILEGLLAIVECVQSPAAFLAQRLHKAIEGAGTDDRTLIRIIVSRSEIDMGNIKAEYERIYDRTLHNDVKVTELDCQLPPNVCFYRLFHIKITNHILVFLLIHQIRQ